MFHIGEDGEPRPCKAKLGNCPLGPADEHHTTKESARAYYERQNEDALFASLSRQYFPLEDLAMEAADEEVFVKNDQGQPYALNLKPGRYVLADPELILADYDDTNASAPIWEKWARAANVALSPEQSAVDPKKQQIDAGKVFAAKINGYTISAIGTGIGQGEFSTDKNDVAYSRSGLLAAVPVELLEKMNHDYSLQPAAFIEIESDSVAVYSESSENIYFGDNHSVFTGYPEDDEDDYED